jgi:hypothetical protein
MMTEQRFQRGQRELGRPVEEYFHGTSGGLGSRRERSESKASPHFSRRAAAVPGRDERWGVWGAISGPPM